MIDISKEYRTRNGFKVRLATTDGGGGYGRVGHNSRWYDGWRDPEVIPPGSTITITV